MYFNLGHHRAGMIIICLNHFRLLLDTSVCFSIDWEVDLMLVSKEKAISSLEGAKRMTNPSVIAFISNK